MTFAPGDCGARVEIEDDMARADGHFSEFAFAAVDLAPGKIRIAKVALLDAQDGNVGDRADSDLSEFRVADFMAGLVVGLPNDFRQGMPSASILLITLGRLSMTPVAESTWRSVEIESGKKPFLCHGLPASAKVKEPPPWPTSNLIPPLAGFQHVGRRLAFRSR